jgi:hypothetical protein
MAAGRCLATALLFAGACGASAAERPDGGPLDLGSPPPDPAHGEVRLVESYVGWASTPTARGYLQVSFQEDGIQRFQELVATDGPCRHFEFTLGICDEPCAFGSEACTSDDVCVPYPRELSAGTLRFSGTRVEIEVEPSASGYAAGSLPGDLFEPGAAVVLEASGGEVPGFALEARGVAPLVAEIPPAGPLPPGPLAIEWTPSEMEARVRLILVSESAHGQPLGTIIECDVADTGSLEVPASMVEAYPGPGNCGRCPSSTLTRYTYATANLPGGPVVLLVGNEVEFLVGR